MQAVLQLPVCRGGFPCLEGRMPCVLGRFPVSECYPCSVKNRNCFLRSRRKILDITILYRRKIKIIDDPLKLALRYGPPQFEVRRDRG